METSVNFRTKWMYIIGMVLFLPLLGGCQESEDPYGELRCQVVAVDGLEDDVVGKWKMVRRETVFFNPETTDHSCDNVIYHFRKDGILEVSSNIGGVEHTSGNGEYAFELIPSNQHENKFVLKIGHLNWSCDIEGNKMVLSRVSTDGPILNFLRIE